MVRCGDLVQGRCVPENRERADLVGRRGRPLTVEAQGISRISSGMHDECQVHVGADRMGPELEGGDDTEVAATALDAPEEFGFTVGIGGDHPSVGSYHIHRQQVVATQPEFASQPAETTAEGEARDAGFRHDAHRHGEPKDLRLPIQFTDRHPALGAHRAGSLIDPHRPHRRQVDHQSVIAYSDTGDVVATRSHRERQLTVARERHRSDDVRDTSAAGDQRRSLVDHPVPHRPRAVVARRRRDR